MGLRWLVWLDTPQPSEDVRRKHGDPSAGRDSSEGFLAARFAVGKLISAYDDGDQTGDLCDGAGEQCLQGGKTVVERRALRMRGQRDHEQDAKRRNRCTRRVQNRSWFWRGCRFHMTSRWEFE